MGTSNLNHRSLRHDLEIDIVLRKRQSLKALTDQFERDLTESQEVRAAPRGLTASLGRFILMIMKDVI